MSDEFLLESNRISEVELIGYDLGIPGKEYSAKAYGRKIGDKIIIERIDFSESAPQASSSHLPPEQVD